MTKLILFFWNQLYFFFWNQLRSFQTSLLFVLRSFHTSLLIVLRSFQISLLIYVQIIFLFFVFQEALFSNTIVIKGEKKSLTMPKRPGITKVYKQSQKTTKALLLTEGSISMGQTGSQSSFQLPSIRGQEFTYGEVWLDENLIYDPWNALPFSVDFDLNQFDSLEVNQGVSPINITSTNPFGSIHFNTRTRKKQKLQLTTKFGRPFGESVQGRYDDYLEFKDAGTVFWQLFLKKHQTTGKYTFYSDEGDPYNLAAHKLKIQDHNDRRSWQIAPLIRYERKNFNAQLFLNTYRHNSAVPPWGIFLERERDNQRSDQLALSACFFDYSDRDFLPKKTYFLFNFAKKHKTAELLPLTMTAQEKSIGVSNHWVLSENKIILKQSLNHLNYINNNNLFQRNSHNTYLGFSSNIQGFLTELKLEQRKYQDSYKNELISQNSLKGASLNFGLKFLDILPYAQIAILKRPPTLLEQFGDFSFIDPSLDLKNESMFHKELGIKWSRDSDLFYLAFYEDFVADKIIFLPNSTTKIQAKNLTKTHTLGIDLGGEKTISFFSQSLNLAYIKARNIENSNTILWIPNIPKIKITQQMTIKSNFGDFGFSSKYLKEIYRDQNNVELVPYSLIHNLSYSKNISNLQIEIGLENILDEKSLVLQNNKTGKNGRTGLSDMAGFSLCGRSFWGSLSIEF